MNLEKLKELFNGTETLKKQITELTDDKTVILSKLKEKEESFKQLESQLHLNGESNDTKLKEIEDKYKADITNLTLEKTNLESSVVSFKKEIEDLKANHIIALDTLKKETESKLKEKEENIDNLVMKRANDKLCSIGFDLDKLPMITDEKILTDKEVSNKNKKYKFILHKSQEETQ